MIIFIPTRGRLSQQYTRVSLFAHQLPYRVIMVVPECEQEHWMDEKFVVPDEYKFSDIRQAIVDKYWEEDPYHVCIDDDLKFYIRKSASDWRLRYTELDDIIKMFKRIENYLEDYAHGALSPREGNNRVVRKYLENTRAMRFHFYDAEIIHKEGLDFRDVVCRQDFHMTLSLLELGYNNVVDFEYAQGQRGSQAKGGCERYRTLELMAAEAYKLQELHPVGVKVVQKKTKSAWGGMRTDVTCQWKKSFCIRQDERKLFRSENEGN